MPVRKLGHYSIRTGRLEETKKFYVDVLGLRVGFRPPLPFPGVWLYQRDDDEDYGIVHLLGTGGDGEGLAAYLGDKALRQGTGAIDHLAFLADDIEEFRERLQASSVPYREREVPGLGLRQMFFEDPAGVTIEMNFPANESTEPEGSTACPTAA